MSTGLLLPACYLPNISYFSVINRESTPIIIEQFENYPKQTYRTRTQIATANGVLDLIIPIMHGRKDRTKMKDVCINYDHPWQRLHWLSIQTAYRSSPYFEFYEDDFKVFYETKFERLLEFNVAQLSLLLKLLKLERQIIFSESYKDVEDGLDYRSAIHPRKPSFFQDMNSYYQVFEQQNGFLKNLSIVDLLFNQGPASKSFL